jgi:TonB family protein
MTLAALAVTAAVAAQQPARTSQSAGAVVLLANTKDAQATEAVRAALLDPDPLVRRAAARVAAVAHTGAFDVLQQALHSELDPIVAAEFVKDIILLAGADALPIVESAATRAGAPAILEIADWCARMDVREFASRLPEWGKVPDTQDGLLRSIKLAIALHPDARDAVLKAWGSVANERARKSAGRKVSKTDGESAVQTPSPLAARLLRDTLMESGCRFYSPFFAASVGFAPDGRPNAINVQGTDLGDACSSLVVAIARIAVADSGDPVRHPHRLVIPMLSRFHECTSRSAETPLFDSEKAEGVRGPRLVREVKPTYTSEAAKAKLQGRVDMEAIVSIDGCVTSARVTRSLGILDAQAIAAVLQWEFEPARFADRSVATYVSVDLTFTLK